MQLGILFYTIGTIPEIILWALYTDKAVLWFGFDEETAQISQSYAYFFLFQVGFGGIGEVVDNFLEIMGHEQWVMWVELGSAVLETLMVLGMAIYGIKDLWMIGLAQSFMAFFLTLLYLSAVIYKGWIDDYWEGLFLTNGLKDRQAVKNMLTTAIPLGISWLLTYGEVSSFDGFV
jgi:Na+-driven multidrug efflux pump